MEALIGFHKELGVVMKSLMQGPIKVLVLSNEERVNPDSPGKNQRDITETQICPPLVHLPNYLSSGIVMKTVSLSLGKVKQLPQEANAGSSIGTRVAAHPKLLAFFFSKGTELWVSLQIPTS